MASIGDIRHHIGVVTQTRQITKAMHMISTSKMQKTMQRFESSAHYMQQVRSTMKDLLTHNEGVSHFYLEKPHGERRAYVVIASDKGLAGGYNNEVLSLATRHMRDHGDFIFTVGEMAREWFEQEGRSVDIEFTDIIQHPTLDAAREMTGTLLELFEQDHLDQVYIVYTHMVNMIERHPTVLRLLPVRMEDFDDVPSPEEQNYEITYEPSAKAVLDLLIPQYIIGIVYGCLLLSFASEHSARLNAMDAATRNADELISKLSIQLNRARQAAITNEISEIISGADALEERE